MVALHVDKDGLVRMSESYIQALARLADHARHDQGCSVFLSFPVWWKRDPQWCSCGYAEALTGAQREMRVYEASLEGS